ncbi:MAG: beta-lactamase family protein, partial [Hydrococcus sp. CSU_1_8]|nr:beta-lactamase family protein [Hydrococcus sp. CSU_1_8]
AQRSLNFLVSLIRPGQRRIGPNAASGAGDRQPSGTPGATVSIITPEGTWTGASGFSNLAEGIPMQPDDQFNIASRHQNFYCRHRAETGR